ncbi:MAG: MBOAT family protein [Lachnospiraceae bacterium]|nr:MBOAT family protein [Lachnospiraceae bacterium]
MSVTSFYFLIFTAVLLAVYYLVPERLRAAVLLAAGGFFVYFGGGFKALILMALQCLIVWFLTARLSEAQGKIRTVLFVISIALCLCPLILLKYIGIQGFMAPVGISYYSLSLVSMTADVYLGMGKAPGVSEALLFGSYFPALTSGPILYYREDSGELLGLYAYSRENVLRGLQRMLWGLMKKLVISERLAVIAGAVFGEPETYGAVWLIIGTFSFSFQLYTDFSGCMDIILGLSEALGIHLPENFDRPFLSRTVAEYWRRWHMTLGAFMKNYLFYPLLRTRLFTGLNRKLKKSMGKKAGKTAVTALAMLVLWTAVGYWHGGDIKYVIGSGLLHWFYIVTGEIINPKFNKFWKRFSFGPDAPWLNALRVVRTFCLVSIGFVFFRADTAASAVVILKRIFTGASGTGSWSDIGMAAKDTAVMLMFLLIMICIEFMADRCPGKDIRLKISGFRLPLRWTIWFALIFSVIIFGKYGPGYDAAAFIYQEF